MERTRHIYLVLILLLLPAVGRGALTNNLLSHPCGGNAYIKATVQSGANVTVSYNPGIGYIFEAGTPDRATSMTGARGLLILPEDGMAPEAYASHAHSIANFQDYYFAVVLEKATAGNVIKVMMQHPWTEFWSLAGHGKGGELAAEMALALHPKVKSLVLIGAALPLHVNLSSVNIFVSVIYFGKDNVVSPESVTESFSLMPGDATIKFYPDLNHYDFTDSERSEKEHHSCEDCRISADASDSGGNIRTCLRVDLKLSGKKRHFWKDCEIFASASDSARSDIRTLLLYSLALAHWPVATEKALSYGDNAKLTPGQNDSKPYPGKILVNFEAVPIPGSNPQRMLWVFVPSLVKGGLIYYAGAAVDPRAYWPLAFEIAALGHLVVIPQISTRFALTNYDVANIILDSNLSLFSEVPKGRWAIGGHSAGTMGATAFAAACGERIYAMVLHSGGWFLNMTECTIPAISLYGTLDSAFFGDCHSYRTWYSSYANLEVTTFAPVPGANHAQVGDYGAQMGDQVAVMSSEEQHKVFAEKSVKFLDGVGEYSFVHSTVQSSSTRLAA